MFTNGKIVSKGEGRKERKKEKSKSVAAKEPSKNKF
jgi:hypothetical protein